MFKLYRTLKIKVPRPCCPWCQFQSDRIEQKLQAMEKQIQELSARLATSLTTRREAENVQAGILAALQVIGLISSHHLTSENPQSGSAHLVGAFAASIAALDRLAEASAARAPSPAVTPSPKTLSPQQHAQITAPRNGS